MEAFWEYVKMKKLQDMENKEIINADEPIRNVNDFLIKGFQGRKDYFRVCE